MKKLLSKLLLSLIVCCLFLNNRSIASTLQLWKTYFSSVILTKDGIKIILPSRGERYLCQIEDEKLKLTDYGEEIAISFGNAAKFVTRGKSISFEPLPPSFNIQGFLVTERQTFELSNSDPIKVFTVLVASGAELKEYDINEFKALQNGQSIKK